MIGYIWTRESNIYDEEKYSIKSQIDVCREAARADGVNATVRLRGPVVPFDRAAS